MCSYFNCYLLHFVWMNWSPITTWECVMAKDSRLGQVSSSIWISMIEAFPKKLSRRILSPQTRIVGRMRSKETSLIVNDVCLVNIGNNRETYNVTLTLGAILGSVQLGYFPRFFRFPFRFNGAHWPNFQHFFPHRVRYRLPVETFYIYYLSRAWYLLDSTQILKRAYP